MTIFVEFTGCSGAGKTSLLQKVEKAFENNHEVRVRRPIQLFFGKWLGAKCKSESLANAILDVILLPWTVASIFRFPEIINLSLCETRARSTGLLPQILLMRSVLRKLGLVQFLRFRCKDNEIVLVDEGPIHIAHIVFVNGSNHTLPMNIEQFVNAVPKPDLTVFVDVETPVLIERTLARSDKPITNNDPEVLVDFLIRAQDLFHKLMVHPRFSDGKMVEMIGQNPNPDILISRLIKEMSIRSKGSAQC